MTIKEFNNWVDTINKTINGDETVEFIVKSDCGIVYAFNILGMPRRGTAKCRDEDTFDERIGKAIAYAKLREIKIPDVEEEPKFKRMKTDTRYYHINVDVYGKINYYGTIEKNGIHDNHYYNNNNYFCNIERANEVANKINFLLKLERLHDIYCLNYTPDWNDDKVPKYFIYHDEKVKRWKFDSITKLDIADVYFPTAKIAQNVCDILNEAT